MVNIRPSSSDDLPARSGEGISGGSRTSRCLVKRLATLISKFDETKKQLVNDVGFGGLLDLPDFNTLNRQFSTWLLSKVDCDQQCLVIDGERKIPFSAEDVSLVFGIPCGRKDVLGKDADITDKGIEYLQHCVGLGGTDRHSLQPVHDFLLRDLSPDASELQKDCFKTAFVVYAMGSMLAPTMKHGYATLAFWGALRCPGEIRNFNWAGYVMKVLLDSSRKVQDDLVKRGSVSSISGCHLFLQVLYLDNISVPGLSPSHDVFPRIKAYGSDKLNALISADNKENCFGFHPVRDPMSVCYSWANKGRDLTGQTNFETAFASSANKGMELPGQTNFETPIVSFVIPTTGPELHTSGNMGKSTASDLFHFIRDKYPELARTQVADLLKVHNAKTIQHMSVCRSSLMKENINLADSLFVMIKNGTHLRKGTCSRSGSKGASANSMTLKDIAGKKLALDDDEVHSPMRTPPTGGATVSANPSKKARQCTPTASQGSSNRSDLDAVWAGIVESMRLMVSDLATKAAKDSVVPGRTLFGKCDNTPIVPRRIRHMPFESPPGP